MLLLIIVAAAHAVGVVHGFDADAYLSMLAIERAVRDAVGARSVPKRDSRGRPVILSAPALDNWDAQVPNASAPEGMPAAQRYARSYHYKGYVFSRPSEEARVIGVVRAGRHVVAAHRTQGTGCPRGTWYRVEPSGYICTSNGFSIVTDVGERDGGLAGPDVGKRLPYQYAEVTTEAAPRFGALPTAEEEQQALLAALEEGGEGPEVLSDLMKGIYFVAITKLEAAGAREYYRTVRGQYVRVEDVNVYPTYPMRGEALAGKWQLPIAFVHAEDRPVFMKTDGRIHEIGIAENHARFVVKGWPKYNGKVYAEGSGGMLAERQMVRVARKVPVPEGIPPNRKWIHVDLTEQTLVAYESERPVYATLVSSGKEGYETPSGLFQIHHKYLTANMSGDDPIDGYYEVEEVPWTMYYWRSYALHGAYWHNDFGKPRSHGCTNIPPADARWLYYWSKPTVPANWHARRRLRGTWVYFTEDPKVET